MKERRRHQPPTDTVGYLRQLPALLLLDRLPTPMFGVAMQGDVAYANPAFAEMLGYLDLRAVTCKRIPDLLTGHHGRSSSDCIDTLKRNASSVSWNHCHGYTIQTTVSRPLLLRDSDELLLIGVTDVTAGLWETARATSRTPRRGAGTSAELADL